MQQVPGTAGCNPLTELLTHDPVHSQLGTDQACGQETRVLRELITVSRLLVYLLPFLSREKTFCVCFASEFTLFVGVLRVLGLYCDFLFDYSSLSSLRFCR